MKIRQIPQGIGDGNPRGRNPKFSIFFSVPEEFLYDPVSKSYGDPSRRPECKSATIEFIAPSEYMLRPPQVSFFSVK